MSAVLRVALTLLILTAPIRLGAQAGGVSTDLKVGPAVGDRLPDFSMTDARGGTRSLRSLSGPRGLVLMIFRSVSWCPYCRLQLVDLQRQLRSLAARGLAAAAVSPDAPEVLRLFGDRYHITLPLLSDLDRSVTRALGLLIPQAADTAPLPALPYEGALWLDPDGTVITRFFEGNYHYRQTLASTMLRVGLGDRVDGMEVVTPHVKANVYASDAAAAPGTRISLIVDVEPAPGVRIYGLSGGEPSGLALDVEPHEAVVVHPLVVPDPEQEFLPALNERVHIYRSPFRLMREASVLASPESRLLAETGTGSFEITGRLTYRACDAARCFPTESVPLRWRVGLKALDR